MSESFKDYLRENQVAAVDVLRAGLPLVKRCETLTDAEWEHLGGQLMAAMLEVVSSGTSLRRLPKTTVCVCPVCKVVVLPAGPLWDAYSHCGRVWSVSPNHPPLPSGFWETARPGDKYKSTSNWAEEAV